MFARISLAIPQEANFYIPFAHTLLFQDWLREKAQFGINHLDFFSIDLGEELSAFNGMLLQDQSAFVADCVTAILKLYERSIPDPKARPTSVILIGHSMGGVVARSIFTSPHYKPGTVRTILTFNSPQLVAPLLFDRGVQAFYTRVNDMWRLHCDDNYELQQTAVVSIAGGLRDSQVHSSLSNLDSIIPCKNHLTVVSTSMPDVWVSLDHTSCLWCQQVITVVSAALSGLIDPNTRQAHESLPKRLDNLRHYFESKVPAALRLESPTPLPSPTKVIIEPSISLLSPKKAETDHQTTPGAVIETDMADKEVLEKVSWITALPVEKKSAVRISGWHKLSKFHVKWDLFQYTQLSNLQILTTVPLDDLSVLLCSQSGEECLDLTKTSAPIPYSIRETAPRSWQTLKAHFLVTHLKDYSLAGYRYLVVSSEHESSVSKFSHNAAFYQGDYGHEIFLVAQLTDPLDIVAMNGNWIGEAEYSLGQSLISHMSLLDANKYMLYHAQVHRYDCGTHPLFTPLILEYSPALREERYEQSSISLRFHEQYLSYNYRRNIHDAVSESRIRVPMSSQDGLHIFVFADPVCPHTLVLTPDWVATIDVLLRNYGVLVIGGFATICVLVTALQLRHAEEHPTKTRKRVVSVLAYILTSPWMLFLLALYSLPVRFPEIFDSMASPWLRNHSYAMMARPWPAPLISLILIVFSIVTVTGWSAGAMILFHLTRKGPGFIKNAFHFIMAHGAPRHPPAPSLPTAPSQPVRHHRRSPSVEMATGSWPGAWCISQPKTAVLIFLVLVVVAFLLHSALAVIAGFIILILPITTEYPSSPQTEESLLHYRHALFVFYSPALILIIPDLIVWFNNMHFEYRILDSYERFAIMFVLHAILSRYTSPSVLLQRSSIRIHWILIIVVTFLALYCLFPVYRSVDALFIAAVFFCFDHVIKIFSTPPQDRFLKAQ